MSQDSLQERGPSAYQSGKELEKNSVSQPCLQKPATLEGLVGPSESNKYGNNWCLPQCFLFLVFYFQEGPSKSR